VGLSQYPGDEACKSGWKRPGPPRLKNLKIVKSAGKVMANRVFGGHKCVLLVDFMQQGTTINAGAYCTTLLLLSAAIKRKRLGCLRKVFFSNEYFNFPSNRNMYLLFKTATYFGVLLLHVNARPHSANAA
jgi:hypothetical protein